LLDHDAPGNAERAAPLLNEALATARGLGMAALVRKAESMGAGPIAECVFRREGEYWSISFDGEHCRLKDTKGLRYLAALLANHGRNVPALELAVSAERQRSPGVRELADAGLDARGLGDAGEVLDASAMSAYKRRLDDLDEELEEAEAWSDPERAAHAREERDFIARELAGAVGLGGRSRLAGSSAERARQSVTKAIKAASERIAENCPGLASHLQATLHTGLLCRYQPDPRSPITWQL
jgi:hypothetical protein